MSLFARLLFGNTLVAIVMLAVLVLSPAALTFPRRREEVIWVAVALLTMIVLSAWSTRLALRPLTELRGAMESTATSFDVRHAPVLREDEVGQVAASYNAMIDRLRSERARSAGLALAAQEGERLRIARELHDGVGQSMTAVLLLLGQAGAVADEQAQEAVRRAQDAVRGALDEVREISARLRPGVLDDLGLVPALTSLTTHADAASPTRVSRDLAEVGHTTREQDLAVYRICQEALTNVLRHAHASAAVVTLRRVGDRAELTVDDDGVGLAGPPGAGRTGMSERAMLVDGTLDVRSRAEGGTRVRLTIPLHRDPVVPPVPARGADEEGPAGA